MVGYSPKQAAVPFDPNAPWTPTAPAVAFDPSQPFETPNQNSDAGNAYLGLTHAANSDLAAMADLIPNAGAAVANVGGGLANLATGHPYSENAIQGDYASRALESAGLNRAPEPGMAADIGASAGHFAAGTVAVDAAAPALANAVIPGLWRNILADLGPTSLSQFSRDIVTAITAGAGAAVGGPAGAEVEKKLTGDTTSGQTGAAIGGLGGAMVGGGVLPIGPVTLAVKLLPPFVKRLVGVLSAKGQTELASRLVQKAISNGLSSTDAQAGLQRGQQLTEQIPGFNPSVAESTGSQSLVNEQRFVQATAQGTDLEGLKAREAANTKAVQQFAGAATPAGPEISAVVDTARGTVDNLLAPVTTAETALIPGGAANAGPRAGSILRRRYEQLKAQVKSGFDKQFAAVRAAAPESDLQPAFAGYARDVRQAVDPGSVFTKPEDIAPVLRERVFPVGQATSSSKMHGLSSYGPVESKAKVTLSDLMVLRQKLSDGIIDAISGTAPNRAWVRQMVVAKGKLDTLLKGLPLGPEYQDLISRYYGEYVSRFDQGTAFKVGQRDSRGFVQTTDEKVASQFADGSFANAQQFKQTFGDDPRAMTALRSAVTDDFRTATVRDGVINPRLAETWVRNHDGLFRVFPDMEVTAQGLVERQLDLNATRESIENTALARSVEGIGKETKTPEQMVNAAMTNSHLATELLASAKSNPDALAGLQRYLFENAPEGATLADYLDNPLVRGALSTQHLADLRAIFDAKNMMARVGPATGTAADLAPLGAIQEKLGIKIPSIVARTFAVASGRISEKFVLTTGAANMFNQMGMRRGRELLEKVLFDPALARTIASSIYSRGRAGYDVARRLQPWMVYYGLSGFNQGPSP